jgi:hypothetical protein
LEHNKPIADYSKVFMQENTVKASIKIWKIFFNCK